VIKRPRPQLGQMPFELPEIRDFSKPAVLLHKNARYVLFKPQDPLAAAILADVTDRMDKVWAMRQGKYWHINEAGKKVFVDDWAKIQIWRHLGGDVGQHPLCEVLRARGIEIGVVPTLANYIKKEMRQVELENTGYPVPVAAGASMLFERCSVGTNLLCTQEYRDPGTGDVIFKKDSHYMVVKAGSEGVDTIKISKNPLLNNAAVKDNDDAFEWSEFNAPMEEYFDDTEDMDLGLTVAEAYPERVAAMRKKIDALGWELFEHVKVDAAMEVLKRSSINGKLMRMGKTSEALVISQLWGTKKIGVFGSKNVCLTWMKECKRLGITDYVLVDTLSDLDKPGRLYLMRYGWARQQRDPTEEQRNDKTNYLRGGERSHQVKVAGSSKTVLARYSVLGHHPCPHCKVSMVRPVHKTDGTGKIYRTDWTPLYGFMCVNKDCTWTTDNRKKKGSAWQSKQIVIHKPGTYVDWGLAAHSQCSHENVPGRQCLECKETDGVWIPQITKRLKRRFGGIIPDEVHNMKDPTSQTYRAISRMRARRKYAATGTLVSNGPMDPYWIFQWMFRGPNAIFNYSYGKGAKEYEARFCDHAILEKPAGLDEETGEVLKKIVKKRLPFLKNPTDWWKFICSKFLRRNYSDPLYEQSLLEAGMFKPEINIQKLICPMTPPQIKLMLSALKDFKDIYEKHKLEAESKNKEVNKAFVISQMSNMCTIATAPEAINDKLGITAYEGPNGGGKVYPITMLVRNRVASGGKVLILSDYVHMQKAIEAELMALGIGVLRFKTSWSTEERLEAQDRFADDPTIGAMVAGTRAVSESLDFSVADTAICCDVLWSPAFQQQAWSRILQATKRMRICDIFLALSENSIDEHKYDTFYAKTVASEQSQDRRVVSRRSQTVDIKWFADRVIEEAANLSIQMRDLGLDFEGSGDSESTFMVPVMGMGLMEERAI
jgi:hypothetical protein